MAEAGLERSKANARTNWASIVHLIESVGNNIQRKHKIHQMHANTKIQENWPARYNSISLSTQNMNCSCKWRRFQRPSYHCFVKNVCSITLAITCRRWLKWVTNKWFSGTTSMVFLKNLTWTLLKARWSWRSQRVPMRCCSRISACPVIRTCESLWAKQKALRDLVPSPLAL